MKILFNASESLFFDVFNIFKIIYPYHLFENKINKLHFFSQIGPKKHESVKSRIEKLEEKSRVMISSYIKKLK